MKNLLMVIIILCLGFIGLILVSSTKDDGDIKCDHLDGVGLSRSHFTIVDDRYILNDMYICSHVWIDGIQQY